MYGVVLPEVERPEKIDEWQVDGMSYFGIVN